VFNSKQTFLHRHRYYLLIGGPNKRYGGPFLVCRLFLNILLILLIGLLLACRPILFCRYFGSGNEEEIRLRAAISDNIGEPIRMPALTEVRKSSNLRLGRISCTEHQN